MCSEHDAFQPLALARAQADALTTLDRSRRGCSRKKSTRTSTARWAISTSPVPSSQAGSLVPARSTDQRDLPVPVHPSRRPAARRSRRVLRAGLRHRVDQHDPGQRGRQQRSALHHFKNKEGLYLAVVEWMIDQKIDWLAVGPGHESGMSRWCVPTRMSRLLAPSSMFVDKWTPDRRRSCGLPLKCGCRKASYRQRRSLDRLGVDPHQNGAHCATVAGAISRQVTDPGRTRAKLQTRPGGILQR